MELAEWFVAFGALFNFELTVGQGTGYSAAQPD